MSNGYIIPLAYLDRRKGNTFQVVARTSSSLVVDILSLQLQCSRLERKIFVVQLCNMCEHV